ncbi:MAG: Gfo/Idh/MocA family oxidoreductase, partial [Gemmatimonadaceae bacterium]
TAGELVFAQAWQLMFMPPWNEHGWRGDMTRRTLHEAGVHLIDFLIALFGELPHSVSGTMSSGGLRNDESDAVCVVTLEFSRGRMAQLIQNRLCKGETHYFEVRADTTNASYRASFGGRARVTTGLHRSTVPHLRVDYGVSGIAWQEKGTTRTFLARNPRDPRTVATRLVLEQTIAAFADGTPPPASGADGRGVLRVIDACYQAAASGRRISIAV